MFGWHPLDPLGFGRLGYERAMAKFQPLNPGRSDLVVAVTGANSGLGLALTQQLAKAGCTVYMLCRSLEKGEEAKQRVTPNDHIHVKKLDVSSLAAIKEFKGLLPTQVDVLVQNAGMIADAYVETAEGLESTVATHVVGPYALREVLNPKRCIWVTSGGAYSASLDVNTVFKPSQVKFDGVAAYANCKRAQLVLARKLGDDIMHPGWADSPGVQHSLPRFYEWTKNYLRTADQGVDTITWLILNPPTERNFWFDRAPAPEHKWYARTQSTPQEEEKLVEQVKKAAAEGLA